MPLWLTNLQGCKTTYHPNYYIHSNALVRTYYQDNAPSVLHISQRLFVEAAVCELFAVMMTVSWYVNMIFKFTYLISTA